MSQSETYRDVIGRLYAATPQGETEDNVRWAEVLLDRPFPLVLREHYLFAAHGELLNQAQDRLLAPSAVRIAGGALVFYEENQRVNYWGILENDLGLDDPPVHAAWNEQPLQWELDHETLSDFFRTMAYWQAVNGASPNFALGLADEAVVAAVERHWPEVGSAGERWGLRVFSRSGQAVCVLAGGPDGPQVNVAGRTPADLRAIQALLPVRWDVEESQDG